MQRNSVGQIKMRRRFIQKNQGRILGQSLGNHHTLAFSIGKIAQIFLGIGTHTHPIEGFFHQTFILSVQTSQTTGIRTTAQSHHLEHLTIFDSHVLRQHYRLQARQFRKRQSRHIQASEIDFAGKRFLQATQSSEQSRFTTTIRTDKRNQLTRIHLQLQIFLNHMTMLALAVSDAQMFASNHINRDPTSLPEYPYTDNVVSCRCEA